LESDGVCLSIPGHFRSGRTKLMLVGRTTSDRPCDVRHRFACKSTVTSEQRYLCRLCGFAANASLAINCRAVLRIGAREKPEPIAGLG